MSARDVGRWGPGALVALTLLAAAGGCKEDDCLGDADLVAGCGARVDGAALHLGDAMADVEQALGSPAATRDLGTLGTWFEYPSVGLSGYHADRDGVPTVTHLELGEGFPGTTAGGVGVGASEGEVAAAFDLLPADPFLGARWAAAEGIAFSWEGGAVATIQIVPVSP